MPDSTLVDRRRSERRIVARPLTLVVDSNRKEIANTAFAVDLSEVGARIRASIKLVPGQHIVVVPNEGTAQAVRSCVVWVGEEGSPREGEAGIAFVQPLAANA